MIPVDVVRKVCLSTCSIGVASQPHETVPEKDYRQWSRDISVLGTGFLITPDCVLTNGHIIDDIWPVHRRDGDFRNCYLTFNYAKGDTTWDSVIVRIHSAFTFKHPTGDWAHDAGLLWFTNTPNVLGPCGPVQLCELSEIVIGRDIAICGYYLGNELLDNKDLGLDRHGPVVHAGIISAIAPFDAGGDPRSITRIMTSLNTAGGFSGSPLFFPDTGAVIGLHYAGVPGFVGVGLPIDKKRIDGWLRLAKAMFSSGDGKLKMQEARILPSGDIV